MGEVGHQEILRGTGVPFHFIYQVESRVSSYVWWRSVPNRVPCHVQTRDVEQVLGEWKKWIAESFLEELVNNFLLFSGIGN